MDYIEKLQKFDIVKVKYKNEEIDFSLDMEVWDFIEKIFDLLCDVLGYDFIPQTEEENDYICDLIDKEIDILISILLQDKKIIYKDISCELIKQKFRTIKYEIKI